jgi:hypothetical protein
LNFILSQFVKIVKIYKTVVFVVQNGEKEWMLSVLLISILYIDQTQSGRTKYPTNRKKRKGYKPEE